MKRVFVDTGAWYALAAADDASHRRAVTVVEAYAGRLATTDHVLVETWAVARSRRNRALADALVATILGRNLADVLPATAGDVRTALSIGERFADQDFSLVDRTSWAVMERNGIDEAVSFDADFAIYRYGPGLSRAFTIHR